MTERSIDWSQLWYPGPKRQFTAEEMARAGNDRPSATLWMLLTANVLGLAAGLMLGTPPEVWAPQLAVLAMLVLLGLVCARWLWRNPWRRPLFWASLLVAGMMIGSALLLKQLVPVRQEFKALAALVAIGGVVLLMVLYFLVIWRAQQIEARLTAQAEREQAIEMARRLAAAQIEPHFLFNTLASLQHWVDTADPRASTLLTALTGYLRTTLPMFKQPMQPLGDELLAIERYLQVMQARLGQRLAWSLAVPDDLRSVPLPSGVLLTLVENAVQHGIEPALSGGTVRIAARREGGTVHLEVADDGAGPAPDWQEGVGLTNVRQRLELLGGRGAALSLRSGPAGGCVALLTLPETRR
ncbi:MAG: sensor histidine kinase [Rubrivivax sp.]|jgi:signal transduction histidine kinase